MFKSLNNRNTVSVAEYSHYHSCLTREIHTALNVTNMIYLFAILRIEPRASCTLPLSYQLLVVVV